MEMVSQHDHNILKNIFELIDSKRITDSVFLEAKDLEHLNNAGCLQSYDELIIDANLPHKKREASVIAQWSQLAAQGIRVVITNSEFSGNKLAFYKIEMAALRKQVLKEKLKNRKQTVSSNEKIPDEHKPQEEQTQNWQQRYVTPKYEDTVLVAVRVEPETRDKFHAVMRAKETTAQEFLSQIIIDEVKQNPDLVTKGEHMEAAGTKKNYRTKLQILKEENARLRDMTGTGSSHPSR